MFTLKYFYNARKYAIEIEQFNENSINFLSLEGMLRSQKSLVIISRHKHSFTN